MEIVADYAFSGSTCPNPNDPLFIHLRIMSNNVIIYNKLSDIISNTLENRILGKNYSYENNGKNIGAQPLTSFMNKIILIELDIFHPSESAILPISQIPPQHSSLQKLSSPLEAKMLQHNLHNRRH